VVKKANFKQGTIHYTVEGEGRAIVFIHGFLETSKIWMEFTKELKKYFKIIAIDLPGHGKSDCYGYIHTMELMAQSVHSVLEELNLRKYIMVGHSMGGYVSLAYAELYPDNLRGLVLFHSWAFADSPEKIEDRNRAISLVKKSQNLFVKGAIKRLFNPKFADFYKKEVEEMESEAKGFTKQGIIDSLEGMKQRKDREVILKFASYPILFIIGKNDPVIDFLKLKEQSKIPSKSFSCILSESGHMGFIEEKNKSLKALKRFIRIAFSKM
jgi:pimeloyl-ACP methyl ester carboxylesterase